jgi:SAM-dependent methyltransferase
MRYFVNRILHVLRRIRAYRRHGRHGEFSVNLPTGRMLRILRRNKLGFYPDGTPTWWYSAIDLKRNEEDELTKAALRYVDAAAPKNARVLVTGCGTGAMLFWLAQRGFTNLDGFDYLDNVVRAAQEIGALGNYPARIWQADGFNPNLERDYDVVLVLHWLYSAWSGNYGNASRAEQDREGLLADFLRRYSRHIRLNGTMMLELVDSISDHAEPPSDMYPIRHSFEHVARCASREDLTIERRMFNFKYGYLPRMLYVLRKTSNTASA